MNKFNQKWVSTLFGSRMWAITLGQTTYFSCPQVSVDSQWLKHEDVHKRQWKEKGYVVYAITYLWYQMWYGYENNPYEIEARNT